MSTLGASQDKAWIAVDGELKLATETSTAALEGGASVGWGVFTTGAIVRGRPVLPARHIERLRGDATRSALLHSPADENWSARWSDSLANVIRANGVFEGAFRLTLCARGEGRWHAGGTPREFVAAIAMSLEASPIEAWLAPYRIDARSPLRGVKSTSYAPWHLMSLEARARNCAEALYRDSDGFLCEGARSNLFWRRGEEVFTPDLGTGCLPGIARAQLLEWLGRSGSSWRALAVRARVEELSLADEAFLCSSTLGPRALTLLRCDEGGVLWRAAEGPVCRALRERWRRVGEES